MRVGSCCRSSAVDSPLKLTPLCRPDDPHYAWASSLPAEAPLLAMGSSEDLSALHLFQNRELHSEGVQRYELIQAAVQVLAPGPCWSADDCCLA